MCEDPQQGQLLCAGLSGQRYAIFPTQGRDAYGQAHTGWGISVGTNGVSVFEHANNSIPSLLVYDAPLSGWTNITTTSARSRTAVSVCPAPTVSSNTTSKPNAASNARYG